MLTPFQFSQLAAAAWSGPALLCHFAGVERYVSVGGHASDTYQVSYHAAKGRGYIYLGRGTCPFAAILAAVGRFAQQCTVPLLGAAMQGHAARVVSAAEQAFSGYPMPVLVEVPEVPVVVCVVCSEGRDAFGQCRCCYVPAVQWAACA